jgi:uncharacterized protein YjiS (DUF1127 family)
MATTIHNQPSLGKFGELVFTRQTPQVAAERHKGLLDSFRAWRKRRNAEVELPNLSDRGLADIGSTRGDIGNAVRVHRAFRC